MSEVWVPVAVVIAYFVLSIWVFPRFGVKT